MRFLEHIDCGSASEVRVERLAAVELVSPNVLMETFVTMRRDCNDYEVVLRICWDVADYPRERMKADRAWAGIKECFINGKNGLAELHRAVDESVCH
jgi:hypothetical protein